MAPHTIQVSERLRALLARRREELALTQEEIDGVSAATVRKLENAYYDRFSVGTLADLAIGLSLSPSDIRTAGAPEVAHRMERSLKRRDEYVNTILRDMEQNAKDRLHSVP